MNNLSPAAQAVLDAAINVAESPDAEAIAAAVLRAVAKGLAYFPNDSYCRIIEEEDILAIATELEGTN